MFDYKNKEVVRSWIYLYRAGYYQVRIAEGYEQKTTCMTSKEFHESFSFFIPLDSPMPLPRAAPYYHK